MFDAKLTTHLAELSKINFSEKEIEQTVKEMDTIVALMDTIAEFKDTNTYGINDPMELTYFRKDEAKESMPRQDVLSNALEKTDTCFTVPKVV